MKKIMNLKLRALQAWERLYRNEEGMTTAEYAIGTIAAAAFAGLLLAIMKGGALQSALEKLISTALTV